MSYYFSISFSMFFVFSVMAIDNDRATSERVFREAEEKQKQEEFLTSLSVAPCDTYEQMWQKFESNCNFSFPPMGYTLAVIETKLRELNTQHPDNRKVKWYLHQLPLLAANNVPYAESRRYITSFVFFLQDYYNCMNYLVENCEIIIKYNKKQNYDNILGEFKEGSYSNEYKCFYVTGEIPIEIFNRIWHLPISPLEVSLKPINLFDFSVGGPQTVISHDLVHHQEKYPAGNIRIKEKLIVILNNIIDNYKKSDLCREDIVNAIELIIFSCHHERYNPRFTLNEFREHLDEWFINLIMCRINKGEFPEKYNVDSLEGNLREAVRLLLEQLPTTLES